MDAIFLCFSWTCSTGQWEKKSPQKICKIKGMGFGFWGCLVLNNCSKCYDLSLMVKSTFPAPVEIPLSLFWMPVLWMSVTCVVLWQQMRLVTWWAWWRAPSHSCRAGWGVGPGHPTPRSCQQRRYPRDQKQTFWWLLVKKFSLLVWPKKSGFVLSRYLQCPAAAKKDKTGSVLKPNSKFSWNLVLILVSCFIDSSLWCREKSSLCLYSLGRHKEIATACNHCKGLCQNPTVS